MNSKQKIYLLYFFMYAEFVVDLPTCRDIQQTFPFITFFLYFIYQREYNKQALLQLCIPHIHILVDLLSFS